MKIPNQDLDFIFNEAVAKFVDKRKPVLMTERQFRALCYMQATCDYLYSHGLLKEEVKWTEERDLESINE
jgi:hypothetical protein